METRETGEEEGVHILDEWEMPYFGNKVLFAIAEHDSFPGWLGMWKRPKADTFCRKLFTGERPERDDVEESFFEWRERCRV